jgi:hypothetical protein
LLSDFKRYAERKVPQPPPAAHEELRWAQLAQHYGLPTRLLDWTRIPKFALYFACLKPRNKNGAVFVLNPVDLNREADPKNPRVFDANDDADRINGYFKLNGKRDAKGSKIIAFDPTWNSERITSQQGVFTVHGSCHFTLTEKQVSSLLCFKVAKTSKQSLLDELERDGVNEMSIFPELEHMCSYLKRSVRLS